MDHECHGRGSERDLISDLPDDILHCILLHLRSTPAAARTSVLSRRWRRVWASLPDLVLADDPIHQGASFSDTVDGAIAAYTADPAILLRNIEISEPYNFLGRSTRSLYNVSASRVTAWLIYASRRLAGELDLSLSTGNNFFHKPLMNGIDLPLFERATKMALRLGGRFLLRLPPAGVFAALTNLNISLASIDARELEVLVSLQCPRLRDLTLMFIKLLNGSDLSISSALLRRLKFHVRNTSRLDVSAPNLEELDVSYVADVHVAAPNLAEFVSGNIGQFVFADVLRHLRRLQVTHWSAVAQLTRRLVRVDKLQLRAPIKEDEFRRFMDDTDNLPKCKTMSVDFTWNPHDTVPIVLHLLKRGSGIKKLAILLERPTDPDVCSLACPCQSAMAPDINLDSLEEIEFHLFKRGGEHVEILKKLLSTCSVRNLKNVQINVSHAYHPASLLRNKMYNKVRRLCPPNITVQLNAR